jgi:signal transduction histidine kinase
VTEFAAIVALTTLAAGLAAMFALRALPTLRLQLAAQALVAVALPLLAVTLSGLVMFHMHDDVKLLEVGAAAASSALIGALVLAHSIARRIRSLEDVAALVAEGELKARAPSDGPREVARLGASFNEMAANIERLFAARRQLVAWASHDLRTPVASIRAMLEAIEDGLAEPADYLESLGEQVAALSMLIEDLFELAQIDSGALSVELRRARLAEVVEPCVRGLEAQARARNVSLEVALPQPLPDVECAPRHVQRVLLNLLTNALRHTPADGAIVVSARATTEELQVVVEDSGDGISEEAQSRPGLGLAIARGLIEAQGGRIWAENNPGGGARVGFSLRVAPVR